MNNIKNYNHILIKAFIKNQKQQEILFRKQSLIQQVYNYYNLEPISELYIGFNPAMLISKAEKSFVLGISESDFQQLESLGCKSTRVENLSQLDLSVDSVISGDEFFTFLINESEQRQFLVDLREKTNHICITTLKDYKNQDFKDREFSFPIVVKNSNDFEIYLEHHEHDLNLKNSWDTTVYSFNNRDHTVYGPFSRRAVYFKQLAKFTADAGFTDFVIHKNLMYKSMIRKNYEHMISFG